MPANQQKSIMSSVLEHIATYVLVGIISFVVSFCYTSYRLAPGQNVALIPLSIKVEDAPSMCTVDQEKLATSIRDKNITKTSSSQFSPDSYESYLEVLSLSESKDVLQELVPEQFRQSLEKEKILIQCNKRFNQTDPVFSLEIAALLDQPTDYLLKRSCSMLYQNVEIPILASADSKSPYETLLIRATARFIFFYDKMRSNETAKEKFNEIVQNVLVNKDIELSIKCRVIDSASDIEIGGQRSYRVSADLFASSRRQG